MSQGVMRRRLWSFAAVAVVLACSGPGQPATPPSGEETPPPMLKLRLGVTTTPIPGLPTSILWLAKDLGFYQREGLDVEVLEMTGAPVAITAMQSGDVDIGNVGLLDAIRLNASKTMDLRAIGASGSDDFPFMVARESVATLADLRGKSYAVSRPGGVDDTTSRRMLAANGVSPDEVNFVAVGAPNLRAQALLGAKVDATTVQISTWVTLRGQPGLKVLASMDQVRAIVPNSAAFNAVTTRVLNAEPEKLQRFTTAVLKTARLFEGNKQAWVDAMSARRPDLAASDLDYLWNQFADAWGVNGFLNLQELQRESDFAYQSTPEFVTLPKIGLSEWIDTRFVDAAIKRDGIYAGYDDPRRPIT